MAISSISIREITLPKDKRVVSVDYQISSNGKFIDDTDIVIDIVKDTENLNGREFDLDYTVHDIYYGRIRINFDVDGNSFWGWCKPIVLTKKGDGFSHNNSVIVTPVLTITSDINNCELGGFTVNSNDFILFTGVGFHKYSNWYIKDINDRTIWEREIDKHNLTSIRIPNDILDTNKHYVIEVVYFSNGNQRSNTGKLIIKTSGDSKLAEIVEYNDPRPTAEAYKDMQDTTDGLLDLIVNHLALTPSSEYNEVVENEV